MSVTTSAELPMVEASLSRLEKDRALVRSWLYIVLVALLALVVVGGATRLTDSGLSITEWEPIHGVIPPLSASDWQEEFDKYRQIPEYQQINKGMSLDAFKTIYWWEWGHRFLARFIGALFAVPLAFFWITGRLENHLKPKLLGLLALGALQGAVGWWMVASGLVERTDVSQYRLAVHLTLACILFAAIMSVARGLAHHSAPPAEDRVRHFAGFMVLAVLFQIYLGALVAGLDAGLAFNTWPLMDGALWPQGLMAIDPAWRNFFESPKTVQFVHRLGAYLLLTLAIIHAIRTAWIEPETAHALRGFILLALVLVQAFVGILTLLWQVPMFWALLHQATALILLGFTVAHWRGTKGSYPLPTNIKVAS